ncbi:hypothetical protein H0H92_009759 [Tricholoma furcatifolium]|nr:hypothetical protein H0H92_009759 [Tricholoma furcatifolium]
MENKPTETHVSSETLTTSCAIQVPSPVSFPSFHRGYTRAPASQTNLAPASHFLPIDESFPKGSLNDRSVSQMLHTFTSSVFEVILDVYFLPPQNKRAQEHRCDAPSLPYFTSPKHSLQPHLTQIHSSVPNLAQIPFEDAGINKELVRLLGAALSTGEMRVRGLVYGGSRDGLPSLARTPPRAGIQAPSKPKDSNPPPAPPAPPLHTDVRRGDPRSAARGLVGIVKDGLVAQGKGTENDEEKDAMWCTKVGEWCLEHLRALVGELEGHGQVDPKMVSWA